jgi:PAS domain S-box-containing protein
MIPQEHSVSNSILPFAREDAAASGTYFRALLENSPIAIMVLDARHRFSTCNPAFVDLFQYTPNQLAKAHIDTLISGPEVAEEAARLTRTVLEGNKVHVVAQRQRRDGMKVDVEIYGIPLIIKGELTGVYALYQDVSERNRARNAFRKLSDQLENLQQEERRRWARELHDSTAQELAVLNWNLTQLMSLVGDQGDVLKKLVVDTRDLAQQCSARIRSASYLLHPPVLGEAGLALAIPWMVEGFSQRSGIRVAIEISDNLGRFPADVERAIYRVVQESLANVLRHAAAAEATISLLRKRHRLELTVSNACGVDSPQSMMQSNDGRGGVGISGMRERLEQLGGCLRIEGGAEGTRLTAVLPLEAARYA